MLYGDLYCKYGCIVYIVCVGVINSCYSWFFYVLFGSKLEEMFKGGNL